MMQIDRVHSLLHSLNPVFSGQLRHGDCTGADAEAHDIARGLAYKIIGHPPKNPKQRAYKTCDELWPEKDYFVRNCDIVDNCDQMVATPARQSEEIRSGTWHAIRYSRKMGRTLYICWPDGTVKEENV